MRGRALAVCEVLTAQAYAFAGADSPAHCSRRRHVLPGAGPWVQYSCPLLALQLQLP